MTVKNIREKQASILRNTRKIHRVMGMEEAQRRGVVAGDY